MSKARRWKQLQTEKQPWKGSPHPVFLRLWRREEKRTGYVSR
jgi:hypothetical protein